jgi:hypothetical protein
VCKETPEPPAQLVIKVLLELLVRLDRRERKVIRATLVQLVRLALREQTELMVRQEQLAQLD